MARKSGSHSATTRPRIMRAALELFARKGYAAVTMREIAAQAGVQAGSIYNYVDDKQALLFQLLQDHMCDLLSKKSAWMIGVTPLQQLENFVAFHIDYHIKRTELVFIAYMELRNLTPENYAIIARLRGDYESSLATLLRDGVGAGDFGLKDPKLGSYAIIAMLTGVVNWYRPDGPLSVDEIQERYWHMVRDLVVDPAPTLAAK